jgi:hypothetical protein
MPVPFANELRGTAGEPENDLLEVSVLALPDLETILEEALNLRFAGPWIGKLVLAWRDFPHPGEHKDPARFASPVVPEQIPLSGNAGQVPGLDRPLFVSLAPPKPFPKITYL